MILFKTLRYKNFLSSGNNFTEIDFTNAKHTLVVGHNGAGKCLDPDTEISIFINNPETLKKFQDYKNAKKKDKNNK